MASRRCLSLLRPSPSRLRPPTPRRSLVLAPLAVRCGAAGGRAAARRLALAGAGLGGVAVGVACAAQPPARAEPAALPAPAALAVRVLPGKGERSLAEPEPVQQGVLAFFLAVLRPDALWLCAAALASMGTAWANVQVSVLLGRLSDAIATFAKDASRESEGEPKAKAAAVSAAIGALAGPAMALLQAHAIQAALSALYISLLAFLGERLAQRLRRRMYRALLLQDIGFFDAHRSGELTQRLTTDVQDFKSAFKKCCSTGIKASTQLLGSALALHSISPSLTGLMLGVVGCMVCVGTVAGRFLRRLSASASAANDAAAECAEEVVANVRTVRAFGAEGKEQRRYDTQLEAHASKASWLGVGIGVFQGGSNLCINAAILLVLHQGGSAVVSGELSPGDLMTFLVATQQVQKSLAQLSVLFGSAVKAAAAGGRLHEYAALQPHIERRGGYALPEVRGRLELRGVGFSYPTRPDHCVMDGFDLVAEPGETVAICGASGSGKSTAIQLLERFYDPSAGQVLLDGVDIRELDQQWLREQLGLVSQEPRLFAGTIAENIAYGQPGVTQAEVEDAARAANAHEFITAFPEGFDTQVGAAGTQLSGGQKQRVAIARALIKQPAVLLLDEATSALDNESEAVVQRALDRLMAQRRRTTIIVAHRLSTIQAADKIVVVDRGRVVEQGTHDALMARGGAYAQLQRSSAEGK